MGTKNCQNFTHKIKQPSFGEKRPKLTYTKISRFTVPIELLLLLSTLKLTIVLELCMLSPFPAICQLYRGSYFLLLSRGRGSEKPGKSPTFPK